MRGLQGLTIATGLAACQSVGDVNRQPDLLPLTIEQALPSDVSARAVYMRGHCYFYKYDGREFSVQTTAAPDAGPSCAA